MGKKQESPQEKILDVTVGIPSTGTWNASFGKALLRLQAHFGKWRPPGVTKKIIRFVTANSSMLVRNRHEIVLKALKDGSTHVLFLDCDMKFPPDLIERLWKHDEDFVSANCTTRTFPTEPIAHDLDGERVSSLGRTGLQEVQHVGLAVSLVKTDVFKKMEPPLFQMEWIPDYMGYCGEDVYFCAKCNHAGVKVMIDHDVSKEIHHIGEYHYSYADVVMEEATDGV